MTKSHRLCTRKATDKNIYIYTHTQEKLKTLCTCANIKCNLTIYQVKNFRRRISIYIAHISTDLKKQLPSAVTWTILRSNASS